MRKGKRNESHSPNRLPLLVLYSASNENYYISSQNQPVQHGKGVGIAQLEEHQDSESLTGFSHVLTLTVHCAQMTLCTKYM